MMNAKYSRKTFTSRITHLQNVIVAFIDTKLVVFNSTFRKASIKVTYLRFTKELGP